MHPVEAKSMYSAPLNFRQLFKDFERALFALPQSMAPKKVNDHLYFFGPHDGEAIDLCISTMIHGDELGGLAAVVELLRLLRENNISFSKRVAVVIGNIEAAQAGQRYIERDLNRCFGGLTSESKEESIARVLEPFLAETKFIIDLHQTRTATLSDFFIFPRNQKNIRFAWHLSKDVPIVVHETQFSVDGMCMDSFVTLNGGIGVTYEMGEIGSTSLQVHKTLRMLSRSLALLNSNFPLDAPLPTNIFVFDQIVMNEEALDLVPGWENFTAVKKNDLLAKGSNKEIYADFSGHILFPKYLAEKEQASELCRIVRSVPLEESLKRNSLYSTEV